MAQIMAGDFRKGVTFELDSQVMVIVDFQHVKPGKGAAFVRAKVKNVITGGVIERTFNPSEKYELYYFMDQETFEQIPLNHSQVEDALNYVKENMDVTISFYNGAPFAVVPPNFVELQITHCEPGAKGDTAQGGSKPATLETGYVIQVPLFVNEGDTIRVDTRTGEYMSRI